MVTEKRRIGVGLIGSGFMGKAHALGYAAGWLTGWPAFSDKVRDAFGSADQRLVGFVFIGTPSRPLDERPRPDMAAIVRRW